MEAKKDYVDDLDMELCPICRTNYIGQNEIMCANCLKEHQNEDGELSEDWEEYLSREEEDGMTNTDDEETEGMSVSDITKSSILDDDDELSAGIEFDDDDELNFADDEDDEDNDDDDEDFDDEDFDDDDDDDDDEEDFDDDDE
jgi:hypothetical protein